MRFGFPNLTLPKKSAKALSTKLQITLASAQQGIAHISGYEDWHDLEINHSKTSQFVLDQNLSSDDFIERQASLALLLSRTLNIPDGEAQHALARLRLTGARPVSLLEQIEFESVACVVLSFHSG